MGLEKMRTNKNGRQLTVYGDTKEYILLKGDILPSNLGKNLIK